MPQNNLVNRQIKLQQRPVGVPVLKDFLLDQSPVPELSADSILIRTVYLSLDPFIRGRMSAEKSYAPSMAIGDVMVGFVVGQVVSTNLTAYQPGDWILTYAVGWQDYAVIPAKHVLMHATTLDFPSYVLGILGMPGFAAYMGLLDIGVPKADETLVVSAATGPVGATVGQIGKIKGCTVIGIAGSAEKCAHAVNALGFDICLNHKDGDFDAQLAKALPNGVDIYFENVGGKVFDAIMPHLNMTARIPVCGLIADYNRTELPSGPDRLGQLTGMILKKRLRMQGFIIFDDYGPHFPEFQKQMTAWLKAGKIHYKEEVIQGLSQAPAAFIGLLTGENFGKRVIQVGDEH